MTLDHRTVDWKTYNIDSDTKLLKYLKIKKKNHISVIQKNIYHTLPLQNKLKQF